MEMSLHNMKGKQPVACYQFSLCGCMINWDSQPVVKTKTLGSLLLAASILFVGNTFAAINQLASYLNLQFFSESDLYDSQQKYLFPVINDAWEAEKQRKLDILNAKEVEI